MSPNTGRWCPGPDSHDQRVARVLACDAKGTLVTELCTQRLISSPAVERVGCVDTGGDIPAVVRRLQWSAFGVGMVAPSNGEFAASGDYWCRSCSSGSFACRTGRSARHSAVMGHQVAGRTATTVRRSFQWTGPGKNSERRRCPRRERRRHRACRARHSSKPFRRVGTGRAPRAQA